MPISANPIRANRITANPITSFPIGGGNGDDCPLTFENGILNANRVLCSNQILIGYGTPYVDSDDWNDPEDWND